MSNISLKSDSKGKTMDSLIMASNLENLKISEKTNYHSTAAMIDLQAQMAGRVECLIRIPRSQLDEYSKAARAASIQLKIQSTNGFNIWKNGKFLDEKARHDKEDLISNVHDNRATIPAENDGIVNDSDGVESVWVFFQRKINNLIEIPEYRVAIIGNVDAGKSTTLGVLTSGILDDGRGRARLGVFRHRHEAESGRTSCVAQELLAFNVDGLICSSLSTAHTDVMSTISASGSMTEEKEKGFGSDCESSTSHGSMSTLSASPIILPFNESTHTKRLVSNGDGGGGGSSTEVFNSFSSQRDSLRQSSTPSGQALLSILSAKKRALRETMPMDAQKMVSFLDLAGHERYLRTTMSGLSGGSPDYAMLMVGANAGLTGMAREHLALAFALVLPVFIVVTKVDSCPPDILAATLQQLTRVLKGAACRRTPLLVKEESDVYLSITHLQPSISSVSRPNNPTLSRLCPIFQISNVSGRGVDLLRLYLKLLPPAIPKNYYCAEKIDSLTKFQSNDSIHPSGNKILHDGQVLHHLKTIANHSFNDMPDHSENLQSKFDSKELDAMQQEQLQQPQVASNSLIRTLFASAYGPVDGLLEFRITETYAVVGVGSVVAGTVISGRIKNGMTLYLGPDSTGVFAPVTVRSIHRKRVPVEEAVSSQCSSLLLKRARKVPIIFRRGMVLVDRECAQSWSEFSASVVILFHSTTISVGYQSVLHCGVIRQAVKVVSIHNAAEKESNATTNINAPSQVLRTGDRAIIRFRFVRSPEFLRAGWRILFRDGRTRGFGIIQSLH